MKTATVYAETIAILAAAAIAVHFLAGVDWPWAITAGAAVAVVLRSLLHHKSRLTL
ncbi:MAG TPA: hypothetical protein VIG37_11295 [Methylomirabilota bacterium]|jgi:hypothetical protein